MDMNKKKEIIGDMIDLQHAFFNPKYAPKNETVFQFVFSENEGIFKYYLLIKNKECNVHEGEFQKPVCVIRTDIYSWIKIGNKDISGRDAMAQKKLIIEGNLFSFLFGYTKIFSCPDKYNLPKNLYIGKNDNQNIKRVLVLSGSPRGKKGATELFTEKFVDGLKEAGAEVNQIYLNNLHINPCIGCFTCWENNNNICVFDDKDDMKIFWDNYYKTDLIVWAYPSYFHNIPAKMKSVIDRTFILNDPHMLYYKGLCTHPKKVKHTPYIVSLGVAAFDDKKNFIPCSLTFKSISDRGGMKLIGELYRVGAMEFLIEERKCGKTDEILEAFKQSGYEIIKNKTISKKTKKKAEQYLDKGKMFITAGNYYMDKMIKNRKCTYTRELLR
jgi:putative NADPH-quinone reductase/putative sterol carrier protein